MSNRLGFGPQPEHNAVLREGELLNVATALIAGDRLFNQSSTVPLKKLNKNELWRTTPCTGRDAVSSADEVQPARPGSLRRRGRCSHRRRCRGGDPTYPRTWRGSPDSTLLDAGTVSPGAHSARSSRYDDTPRTSRHQSPSRAALLRSRPPDMRRSLDGRQRCAASSVDAMFGYKRVSPERSATATRLINSRRPSPDSFSRRAARPSAGWPETSIVKRASLPTRSTLAAKEADGANVGGPLPFDLSFEPEWSECGGCSVSPWLQPPARAGSWFPTWSQLRAAPAVSDSVTYFTSQPPGTPIQTVTLLTPQHEAPTAPTPVLDRFMRQQSASQEEPSPSAARSNSPSILETTCELTETASAARRLCSAAVEAVWLPVEEECERDDCATSAETWPEAAATCTSARTSVVTQRTAGNSERMTAVAQATTGTSPCAPSAHASPSLASSPRDPSPRLVQNRHRAINVAVQAYESQVATNIKQMKITDECNRRGMCSVSAEWVEGVRALRDSHVQIMSRHLRHIDLLNRTIDAAAPRSISPAASPSNLS